MGSIAELLEVAMGCRSQRSFARDAGISVGAVSRILSGQTRNVQRTTLEKIAACADKGSGVTIEKLVAAQSSKQGCYWLPVSNIEELHIQRNPDRTFRLDWTCVMDGGVHMEGLIPRARVTINAVAASDMDMTDKNETELL